MSTSPCRLTGFSPTMQRLRWGWKAVAFASAFGLLVAACGDDDDGDGAAATSAEGEDGGEAELTEACEVAVELSESEDFFPTADQIERYQAVAPEELQDALHLAGDAIVGADGDLVATFAAV